MAKVVQNTPNVIVEPWWVKGYAGYIGVGMGALWWVLTSLLNRYIVEPSACRDLESATACVNSFSVSGSIAAILVAIVGTILLVRYVQPRPIVISVASLVLLWDLAALANGVVWWAALLWALVLYGLSYGLFSLVAQIRFVAYSLLIAAFLVVGIRVILLI